MDLLHQVNSLGEEKNATFMNNLETVYGWDDARGDLVKCCWWAYTLLVVPNSQQSVGL